MAIQQEFELDHSIAHEAHLGERSLGRAGFQRALKRSMDIVGALVLLALFLIPMLIIGVLIRLDSNGPALLRQVRVGRHGRRFTLYKFRTMRVDAEEQFLRLVRRNEQQGPLFKMKQDPRITRVGRWVRKSSLDELPQLINVLRGEMSLVGPRPPLPREVEHYSLRERGRLAIKPGMTGLWQVSGRSLLTWDEMVDLDLEYIRRLSAGLDALILLRTIPAVVSGRGAY